MPEENRKELMNVLEIKDAPSFKPISIKTLLIPMPGPSAAYELRFEISIEDYVKNNLKYRDGDSAELDIDYKIKKSKNTYLCIIRRSPYIEKLYREILNAIK